MREWAVLAGEGRLLLSGSIVLASLKAAVHGKISRPMKITCLALREYKSFIGKIA